MNKRACKIAVAGTHSTGKSTFIALLRRQLEKRGIHVNCIHVCATEASAFGFPILENHTFESTAWIIARTIELEAIASISSEVILVDRPVPDALGYLVAALGYTRRNLEDRRLNVLETICASWVKEYDLLFATELDRSVPIGAGRSTNEAFRIAAGEAISQILGRIAPKHLVLRTDGVGEALDYAEKVATLRIAAS